MTTPYHLEKSTIQVYTGDGKGKTTASLGLSLRALGAGMSVYFAQFVKGMHYSELNLVSALGKNFVLKQFGRDCFIYKDPEQADIDAAAEGLRLTSEAIRSGEYDLVVLDECNIAIYFKLFSVHEVIDVIKGRPSHVEIVITGRKCPEEILELADLVTEMKEVKHYYNTMKLPARKGIEM